MTPDPADRFRELERSLLLNGMRVIESVHLEQDGEPQTIRLTWRERLLTWPWRPWIATVTFVPKVPYRGAIQLNANTLVMHPTTFRQLRGQHGT